MAGRITVGDGERPDEERPDASIRADLIRMILTAEDPQIRLHAKGLRLRGAWITEVLDLQGATITFDLSLSHCHVERPIEMVNARLRGLHFSSCVLAGLSGDNARIEGALFIRAATLVKGEISLAGTRVYGDLQICDAVLESRTQDAIFAPSLRVDGSIFLGNYPYSNDITSLVTTGAIFLSSAQVENDVFITNCAITPRPFDGNDAIFQASEEHGHDIVLSLARARIAGILYFKDNQITGGIVNLAGAHAARLRDEPAGPGANYPIRLDGFTYDDFSRHSETSIISRLEWLERKPDDTPFSAQPYENLARVLSHLGHRNDARTVLMRKERIIRRENRRLVTARRGRKPRWLALLVADNVMRFAVGYGYRPGRVLALAVVMVFGLGLFFQQAWRAGDMTPNAAPILVSGDWIAATRTHPDNPAAFWSAKGNAGQDWETFHAFAYAADLVVPIVSLGQETAWAPSTSRSDWGRAGWWLRWFAKAAGWIITALGAAALTGAVRQD